MTCSPERREFIERVRVLWCAEPQISAIEIGERLGITKNAVVGIAHRAGMPGRASPIVRGGTKRPPQPKRSPRQTLPSLPPPAAQREPAPAPIAVPARPEQMPAMPQTRVAPSRACCWPMWPDAERPPREPVFCEAAVLLRQTERGDLPASYCPDHHAVAYVRPPARGTTPVW